MKLHPTVRKFFKLHNIDCDTEQELDKKMFFILSSYLHAITGNNEGVMHGKIGGQPFVIGIGEPAEEICRLLDYQRDMEEILEQEEWEGKLS